MGKKVFAIVSTPRRGGNSERMTDAFLEGAAAAGHTCEKVCFRDLSIGYCRACNYCRQHGGTCIQKDDMAGICEKLMTADVIVLSTPVYKATVSAQLKTVADRMYALNPVLTDKDFYFIAAAGDGREETESAMRTMRGIVRAYKNIRIKGELHGTNVLAAGDIENSPALEEAFLAGRSC